MKNKIIWPVRDENGNEIEEGIINGITFSEFWKQCQDESEEYCKTKIFGVKS